MLRDAHRRVREAMKPPPRSKRLTPEEVEEVRRLIANGWDAKTAGDAVRAKRGGEFI